MRARPLARRRHHCWVLTWYNGHPLRPSEQSQCAYRKRCFVFNFRFWLSSVVHMSNLVLKKRLSSGRNRDFHFLKKTFVTFERIFVNEKYDFRKLLAWTNLEGRLSLFGDFRRCPHHSRAVTQRSIAIAHVSAYKRHSWDTDGLSDG
jgi:hypothetical protein